MEKKKSTQLRNHNKPESKTTRSIKFKPKEVYRIRKGHGTKFTL